MTSLLSMRPQKGVTGATAWTQRHPAGNTSWGQNKARFKLLQGIVLDLGIQSQPVFVSSYGHRIFDCKHQGISIAGKPFPSSVETAAIFSTSVEYFPDFASKIGVSPGELPLEAQPCRN